MRVTRVPRGGGRVVSAELSDQGREGRENPHLPGLSRCDLEVLWFAKSFAGVALALNTVEANVEGFER